jgi:tripartite-type tricarboxylate transporter receptor subunit TctC
VSGAYFQRATDTTFQFAQYRGAAPAMQDLVGGHVDLMFDQPPNSLPHVRDGNIKAYAVTAKVRLASAQFACLVWCSIRCRMCSQGSPEK